MKKKTPKSSPPPAFSLDAGLTTILSTVLGAATLLLVFVVGHQSQKRRRRTPSASGIPCHLRIVHFNDVYEMDNLPVLRSAIDALSAEIAHKPNTKFITTFGGDFLAPSLLSSIDQGRSMVAALNALPVDVLCFGNHESDVPFESLLHRIEEFNGVWLNSNMTSISDDLPHPEKCPPHLVVEIAGSGRCVAFIGLLQGGGKDASLYREGAFEGHAARITPVLDAAASAAAAASRAAPGGRGADVVIPLTHQVLDDDVALAGRGLGFPCILGGHDHDLIVVNAPSPDGVPFSSAARRDAREGLEGAEAEGEATANSEGAAAAAPTTIPILKAGEDAYNCIVVDLMWDASAPPHPSPPTSLTHRVVRLAVSKSPKNGDPSAAIVYAAHEATAELVRKLQSPAVELQRSVLARFPPGSLSSVGTRAGPSTMATCLASAMRDAEGCDVAVLHGGSVRGNKVYDSGLVTFGDLQSECPFPSACVVATIDGAALSAAVQRSRTPWSCGNLNAAALHADDGVVIDPITHAIVSVGGAPLSPTRLYTVLIDSYYLASELPDYCAAHPDRIPPDDAGRPALPILSEYFCSRMWMHLVDRDADGKVSCSDVARFVDEADINGDGSIDAAEFEQVVARRLGENFGGKVVAAQCIACADTNKDGVVSSAELAAFLQRQGMAASDGQRRSMARRRSAEAA